MSCELPVKAVWQDNKVETLTLSADGLDLVLSVRTIEEAQGSYDPGPLDGLQVETDGTPRRSHKD